MTMAAGLILAATSCRGTDEHTATIHRLDRFVADYETLDDASRLAGLDSLSTGISLYLQYNGEDPADIDAALRYLSHSPAVVVFGRDVASTIDDLTPVEERLGRASAIIGRELPAARFTGLYAMVSGDPFQSVIVSDSTVLIALNHYLGTDYPGYNGMPEYRRRTKSTQYISPDVVQAVISVGYPYEQSADEKLLNRMLYDGAVLYAMHTALPDLSMSELTGWTDDEIKWLADNERQIYGAIIERDLLYSTSEDDMRRLLDPAPQTTLLHTEAPGRAARYTGYRIAESYASKNSGEGTLAHILSPEWYNGQNTLAESGYSAVK